MPRHGSSLSFVERQLTDHVVDGALYRSVGPAIVQDLPSQGIERIVHGVSHQDAALLFVEAQLASATAKEP